MPLTLSGTFVRQALTGQRYPAGPIMSSSASPFPTSTSLLGLYLTIALYTKTKLNPTTYVLSTVLLGVSTLGKFEIAKFVQTPNHVIMVEVWSTAKSTLFLLFLHHHLTSL